MSDSQRWLSKRDFMRVAVAIGGTSALSACLERTETPDLPRGTDDPSSLPPRQHAWNQFLERDDHGNVKQPRHHVLLYVDYTGDTPTESERETVEAAFTSLERAYQRGSHGLLFTVGYSPYYFERAFDSSPGGVDLPTPEALAPFEDPTPDDPDAVVHLASDYAQVVLAAEEALKGNRETVNEVDVTDLGEVFAVRDRRTGFIGDGLPAENQDVQGIPDDEPVSEDAPLFMGFKSGFEKNQAPEEHVTIQDGPFADGTTQHISRIRLHLDQWYDQDSRSQRVSKMFCPAHAEQDTVEGPGDNLGNDSQLGSCPAHTEEDARTSGMVGHAQKVARAEDGGRPVILRRDFDTTDGDAAGVHFVSLQESIADFIDTKQAMNGTDVAENSAVGTRTNNGILQYLTVKRRGNYLIPPRQYRSLPVPNPP